MVGKEDDPFLLERPVFRGYVKFPGCNVDGSEIWRAPVEVGSLSHYLRLVFYIHLKWLALGFLNHQQKMP